MKSQTIVISKILEGYKLHGYKLKKITDYRNIKDTKVIHEQ